MPFQWQMDPSPRDSPGECCFTKQTGAEKRSARGTENFRPLGLWFPKYAAGPGLSLPESEIDAAGKGLCCLQPRKERQRYLSCEPSAWGE